MPRVSKTIDRVALLNAALEGLELQRQRIENQIREVRVRLGQSAGKTARAKSAPAKKAKRRKLSAAARKRIAQAQRKRWAEFRKKTAGKQG